MNEPIDAMSAGKIIPGASSYAVAETLNDVSGTFNDRSITYNGSLATLDIGPILRDKQGHINDIYQLADYYVDAEELISSAIRKIYVPFSLSDGWYLTGGNDKTRAKYEEWFKRIHFNDDKLESWFYQYFLFANVYFSLMEDSDIATLPPHLSRISNVKVNGNPLVEFNARSVKQDLKKQGQKALKKFLEDEDLNVRLAGYPKEVSEALKSSSNREFVQLDPKTTFVWQASHPEWSRYAMPMIVPALKPLARKELITTYESALLALAAASFLHIKVGVPKDSNMTVDSNILTAVQSLGKKAMKAGGGIFTTNDLITCEIVQPDVDHMWDKDKYANANEEILGALGINNSVTSGSDASISFGASQVSTKLISLRITAARNSFCELMNRIIRAVNGSPYGLPRTTVDKLPTFCMPVSDLTKVAAFQDACMKLWESGMLSRKTLMETYDLDVQMEYERKKKELEEGYEDVFVKPGTKQNNEPGETGQRGRPTMSDDERQSDPGNSETGRQPKPSSENGSEQHEE